MTTCYSVQSHAHAMIHPIDPHCDMSGDSGMACSTNGDLDDKTQGRGAGKPKSTATWCATRPSAASPLRVVAHFVSGQLEAAPAWPAWMSSRLASPDSPTSPTPG